MKKLLWTLTLALTLGLMSGSAIIGKVGKPQPRYCSSPLCQFL